jgi:hypothetical protein
LLGDDPSSRAFRAIGRMTGRPFPAAETGTVFHRSGCFPEAMNSPLYPNLALIWDRSAPARAFSHWPLATSGRLPMRGASGCRRCRPQQRTSLAARSLFCSRRRCRSRGTATCWRPSSPARLMACSSLAPPTASHHGKGAHRDDEACGRRCGPPPECLPHGVRKVQMRRLAESGASIKLDRFHIWAPDPQ